MYIIRSIAHYICLNILDPSNYSSNENSDGLLKKEFVFTFSALEWQQFRPQEVKYKINDKNRLLRSCRSYYVLPKGSWTALLSEHFWEHTNLQCCLSFKRAKVYGDSNVYIKVIGMCTICHSHFKGIVFDKPSVDSRFVLKTSSLKILNQSEDVF